MNVFTAKMLIEGFPHILLITLRNIKKGEILYIDYNADGKLYDTFNFE